jgi:hypothetical protein
MPPDIDILIVFAEADNEPSHENAVAWVSQFKKFLDFMLGQVVDEKLKILVKSEYDTMTSPRLDNVGILIPILSKEFIASTACMENIEMFYNAVNKNHNRIFKVTKSPLTPQEQPEYLQPLIGYDMYQLDPDSGEIREYTNYFSTDAERQYWMELVDLSYDIAGILNRLKNGTPETEAKNLFTQKIVYLAETSHDLSVERNIITRELQRHGYTVLPDQALPLHAHGIEQRVRKDLNECYMSIHMIGNAYGEIPDGSARSVIDLQHTIASEKSQEARKKNEPFSRLIWITPNLHHTNERQKKFIETIKRDVEMQEGAEILETPLEDFKNIVREELLEAIERKVVKETGGRAIYLLHDKDDYQAVKSYVELIEKCGFHVLMPAFDGQLLEQRQKHLENLRALDGAIIYKGKVNEQWVRMKALDLMKAPGFGRKKPIIAKAILAAPGDLTQPQVFKNQNFRLIEGDAQSFIESLKTFLLDFNN